MQKQAKISIDCRALWTSGAGVGEHSESPLISSLLYNNPKFSSYSYLEPLENQVRQISLITRSTVVGTLYHRQIQSLRVPVPKDMVDQPKPTVAIPSRETMNTQFLGALDPEGNCPMQQLKLS